MAEGFQRFGPYIYGLSIALVLLILVSGTLIHVLLRSISSLQEQLREATATANATQEKRISDRDAFQTKLDALARETNETMAEVAKSNFTLTRAVEDLHAKKRPPAPPAKEGAG